jgi:type II secretory pathway pseudopilin PulG
MEVLISLAILLLGLVGLGYLLNAASDRAREAQVRTEALMHAQSKMAEVIGGSIPLQGQGEQDVEDASDFRWSMECNQGTADNLWSVSITVTRRRSLGTPLAVTLQQMVLDPTAIGSTQDVPTTASTSNSPDSSQSSSSSSSTSSTGN